MVERQQLFHHIVHFGRLVHNDITVKFPALRIVIDTLLQALRIALDQSDGRLQLIGYIGEKFLTHLSNLFLLLNVLLQLIVGGL